MSEAKFTKSQWQIRTGKTLEIPFVEVSAGNLCVSYEIHPTDEEVANANLIAAAPEMYNELQNLLNTFNHESKSVTILDVMRIEKLLAKARGES